MKCDNCGKNEATYFYRQTINGYSAQRRLCADCARQEGLAAALDRGPERLMNDLFGGLFGGFFGGADPFFPAFPGEAEPALSPVGTLPRTRPDESQLRRRRGPAQTEAEAGIPEDAGRELKRRRERQALRAQLDDAVQREDYEQAVQLRDKLRRLDA